MLLTNKHINDILIAKSGKTKRCSSPTAQAPAQIRQYKSLQIELKKRRSLCFSQSYSEICLWTLTAGAQGTNSTLRRPHVFTGHLQICNGKKRAIKTK